MEPNATSQPKALTVGSLFAGIGGFDLAAERVGFQVKWQVEIDDYATRVLEKHWPGVKRYRDIRAIDWSTVEPVDVVCGGFPCQPHSSAGRRMGSADDRDLWPEVVRCLRGTRPRWFLGENVSGLLSSEAGRFFGRVLGDLAESGYDAEWDCIPASAVGAHHRRDRVWIVAYPGHDEPPGWDEITKRQQLSIRRSSRCESASCGVVADTDSERLEECGLSTVERARLFDASWRGRLGAAEGRMGYSHGASEDAHAATGSPRGTVGQPGWWEPEPDVGRVAHGIPARVDRLRGLGNAIVPAVAEWIFNRIKEADANEAR